MARKLGFSRSGYSKNENGVTLPKPEALQRLEKDFDITMNWLFFGKGPVHYKDLLVEKGLVKKTLALEKNTPEAIELLEYMEKDYKWMHALRALLFPKQFAVLEPDAHFIFICRYGSTNGCTRQGCVIHFFFVCFIDNFPPPYD